MVRTLLQGASAVALTVAVLSCVPAAREAEHAPSVTPSSGAQSSTATPQPGRSPTPIEAASSQAVPEPTPSSVPRTATLNVSGDLLWHEALWATAQRDGGGGMDFVPQLASLGPFVARADVAVCHSEVPFAPDGGPYQGYPLFAAPPAVAPALAKLGWDICTTASNHSMDQGWDGLVRTIDVHRSAGLDTVGTYPTQEESETPVIVETGRGVKIGFVSQTFGLNGLPKAKGKEWSVQLLDAERAVADARRAKAAGADIVAVHIHAGDEYVHAPNEQQRRFVEAVTLSEHVDLVFGQHAHVVQPIEKVHGKWVLYGAGNLIAASGPAKPWTYDGYMAEVRFVEREEGGFNADQVVWAPTFITGRGDGPRRVHLIPKALADGVGPRERMLDSAARTRAIVTSTKPEGLVELERP